MPFVLTMTNLLLVMLVPWRTLGFIIASEFR